jgi:hypothetical protein
MQHLYIIFCVEITPEVCIDLSDTHCVCNVFEVLNVSYLKATFVILYGNID